jgi:transposase
MQHSIYDGKGRSGKQEQFIAEYRGLRAHIGENEYLYSIHDNARYNHSKRLCEYLKMSHIKMIPLSSYSPNLNLIERLWGLMKRCVLYNHYYERYDDFCMAIMNIFTKWLPKHKDMFTILYSNMWKTNFAWV